MQVLLQRWARRYAAVVCRSLNSIAVALQPGDANAKLGLAKVPIEMDKPEMALPLLEASAQLEPASATVHNRLATLYRKTGRMEDTKCEVAFYQHSRK